MEGKKERERRIELDLQKIDARIEALKIQYNLFFSGEINVPPESEREKLEKDVRNILNSELRSPRINLVSQNISSKFNLYNNMWKKKLNQIESGELSRVSKTGPQYYISEDIANHKGKTEIPVSLNDEDTFDKLYNKYMSLNKIENKKMSKDDLINKIKLKLISENIVDAKIEFKDKSGKINLKIKKSE